MLNSPGEKVAAPPDAKEAEKSDHPAMTQIAVIASVGLYLFGMVWFYAQVPLAAVAGTGVALLIVVYGFVRWIRDKAGPPAN